MINKLFTTALFVSSMSLTAQNIWNADKNHANLGFIVTHLEISELPGNFKNFEAKLTATKDDFSDAKIELNAETNSIYTGNESRDKHLTSADFFDAENNPKITFKSTDFKKAKVKNNYVVTGELTMHGVTKTVSFNVLYKGTKTNPMSKKPVASFIISGSIKRSDFAIGKDMPNDIVGDEIKLWSSIEFVKE